MCGSCCVRGSATAARCRGDSPWVGSRHGCRCAVPGPRARQPDDGPDGATWRFLPEPASRPDSRSRSAACSGAPALAGPPLRASTCATESYTGLVAADRGSRSSVPDRQEEQCHGWGGLSRGWQQLTDKSQAVHRPPTGCPQEVPCQPHTRPHQRTPPATPTGRRQELRRGGPAPERRRPDWC